MTWPTQKANTTYVDNDADPIWRARFDINQNFENVNNIIDEFNISTVNDKQVLEYNSTNTRFDPTDIRQQAKYRAVISLDANLFATPTDSAGEAVEDYTGGYTIDYTNETGITVGSDSGRSTIVFPTGSYIIRTVGYFGVGERDIQTTWSNSDSTTTYWQANEQTTDGTGDSKVTRYLVGTVQTFTQSTTVYMRYRNVTDANSTYDHPELHIWRIA